MNFLLLAFKYVSSIFAVCAVVLGIQAIVDPVGFSSGFGLPLTSRPVRSGLNMDNAGTSRPTAVLHYNHSLTLSYISLMGARQLATGIILLVFAYQQKWTEMATILAIIGIVVAGTDGIHLWRAGATELARFHVIPGALISALAGRVIYSSV